MLVLCWSVFLAVISWPPAVLNIHSLLKTRARSLLASDFQLIITEDYCEYKTLSRCQRGAGRIFLFYYCIITDIMSQDRVSALPVQGMDGMSALDNVEQVVVLAMSPAVTCLSKCETLTNPSYWTYIMVKDLVIQLICQFSSLCWCIAVCQHQARVCYGSIMALLYSE